MHAPPKIGEMVETGANRREIVSHPEKRGPTHIVLLK